MTDNDKKLIQEARDTHYVDWMLIGSLVDKADTEEAKREIRRIEIRKYHYDEYSAGIL